MDLELIRKIEDATTKFFESLATDIIRLPEATIFLNKDLPDEPFLNYSVDITSPKNIPAFVSEIEAVFEKHGAKPSFSIAHYTSKELAEYLVGHGYEQDANNAWMFFDPNNEVPEFQNKDLTIKQVSNEDDFRKFADVFVEVFSK